MAMRESLGLLLLFATLAGCAPLSTKALSIGLREQNVREDLQSSTPEYSVYVVEDSAVGAGDGTLSRSLGSGAEETVARYKIGIDGEISALDVSPPATRKSKISKEELNCITCIKAKRYRDPKGYVAYPLLAVTAPVDLAINIAAVPIGATVGVFYFGIMYGTCAVEGRIHQCTP